MLKTVKKKKKYYTRSVLDKGAALEQVDFARYVSFKT